MERADGLFFPLVANEESPPLPLPHGPPQMHMRSWVAGVYLRRGNRGCGSAPNSGLRETSGPRQTFGSTRSLPTTLGTMAAVAAASAELLIIGWYIFRVLLQVSVPGFWVGEGSHAAPLNRQAHVAIAVSPTRPILIAAIPACLSAAAGTMRPHPFPAPSS